MDATREDNRQGSNTIYSVGMISSFALVFVTLVTFIVAVGTPPISGPLAINPSTYYPYADVLSRFPRDYYWMYPAILLMLIYVVFMVCVDFYASPARKIFSRIALTFASLSAGIILVDYFLQLSVIQPSLINGELDGIALLTQYNPHGIFIALEEAGYILMSVAFLFLASVFNGTDRIQVSIRWIARMTFILTALGLVVISIVFGIGREYVFEIAVITVDFMGLILLGTLVGVLFRRAGRVP